ncbi:hypothetical protein IRJ41_001445, partial [Triplophysa rosa]
FLFLFLGGGVKGLAVGGCCTMRIAVGSSSVSDATTTGGSTEGLAPNTSCMSSRYCHVASVPEPVLSILKKNNVKQAVKCLQKM